MSSKIVSFRLPVDVVMQIDNMAKGAGTNRTQVVTECISAHSSMGALREFQKGGSIQTYMMDKDLMELLKLAGCTTIGIAVYSIINHLMAQARNEAGEKRFNAAEGAVVGGIAGVAVALAAMGVINALTKER